MFRITTDNMIEVISGDTGILELSISNYTLQEGDVVYFTVKSSYEGDRLIFKEETNFVGGKVRFVLTSEDTNLPIGTYKYDIQCNLADGRVDTVITPAKFKVLGGVTDA